MALNFLNQIKKQFRKGLPFVAYRKPKQNDIHVIFQMNQELHYVEDFTESGFVFAPFDDKCPSVLIKKEGGFVESFDAIPNFTQTSTIKVNQEADKEFYVSIINKALYKMDTSPLKKVVLSRNIEVETVKTPFVLFSQLLHQYEAAFCYIWYHPKIGLWLGATPELLLETQNNQFKTIALAGTQRFKEGEMPYWEEKEIEEQRMVAQFIHDALKNKVSSLLVSDATSIQAGNLWHIKTAISGVLNPTDLKGIIEALHPTPAVCGVPKNEAKEFIFATEQYDREFYTGFLGELNLKEENNRQARRKNEENRAYKTIKNKTALYVNLRCMQLLENRLKVYIGGGITKESVPEKEWQETKDKSSTMLNII